MFARSISIRLKPIGILPGGGVALRKLKREGDEQIKTGRSTFSSCKVLPASSRIRYLKLKLICCREVCPLSRSSELSQMIRYSSLLASHNKEVDMFARSISIHLKPNSVAEFTQLIEKETLPLLRKQKGFQDEMTFVVPGGAEAVGISLCDLPRDRRSGRGLRLTGLSLGRRPSPPSLLFGKEGSTYQEETRFPNARENHEVGFHCRVAPGGNVLALCGELPTPAGFRGLCGRYRRCPAGGPSKEVLLGGRICCDCPAFQSHRARF